MVSKADLVSTSPAPLTRRASELSRAQIRQERREHHRRRTLSSLAVLSVAGLVAAYVGPLGSLGSSADAAEPGAVSQYATTVHDAQTYDSPLAADISLGRDAFSYSVYVKPKPTPTVTAAAASSQASTALQAPLVAPDPGSAQAVAYGMVAARGWGDGEFACLVALWNRESGWRVNAYNRSSGAYGIPQALPGGKMASAGADWQTNAATQIAWGLGYISGRYGSPCGAWGHSQARGWY